MKYLILITAFLNLNLFADETLDHLVLNTSKGPIVIQMDNLGAPIHFDAITKMVELGVYSGINLAYAEADFYVQMGGEEFRDYGFYPEQKEILKHLPNEITGFKHFRGAVTMPSSNIEELKGGSYEMTFMLDRSKELDGKQTIIGFVTHGIEILDELSRSPSQDGVLTNQLKLINAVFMTKAAADAHYEKYKNSLFNADITSFTLFAFLFIILIQLVVHFGKGKIDKQILDSAQLIVLLIATFSLLAQAYPMVEESTMASVAFVGLLILCFKVMASLERSRGLSR
jgi:cyclophilin family peptidyl-prolyl cis-trans isomerase